VGVKKSEPQKLSNIEDYQNLVIVLKKVLEFYANKENYEVNVPQNNVLYAYIEMDKGAQAKFALEKIQEFEKNGKRMEDEFIKNLTTAIQNNEEMPKMLQMIEDFRKINNIADDDIIQNNENNSIQ
jgi:hypothetical protein